MKKLFILTLILFFKFISFAQVVIKKSDDIITVLGRKYYVHTVKKGETLYSLAKVYGVNQSDILKINKEVVKNLKEGDILRIPVVDENYTPEPINKVTFIEYKVKRKESLYSIAKKFNVSQDQIIKYNPQIENGIKKGMILKIPQFENINISAEDEFFYYHQIQDGENLISIARKYKIDTAEILAFNPNLRKKIVVGQIIAIPKRKYSNDQKFILIYNKENIPDFIDVDPNYFEDPNYPPCYKFVYDKKMTFNVALLLPLYVIENYPFSLDAVEDNTNIKFYKKSKVFYDFYFGSLLALWNLKNEGLKINLYVYDTRADSNVVRQILNKVEFKKMDLVLGPVYYYNYEVVKRFAKKYKINFVSPLSKRLNTIKNNPFVFKVNPSDSLLIEKIIEYIEIQDTANVFLINDNSLRLRKLDSQLVKRINKINLQKDSNIVYKSINFSKFHEDYQKEISKDKPAIILVPYKDEVSVTAVLNALNALVTVLDYSITVYGMPEWEAFRNIDPEWIANLHIHYPSPTYTDLSDWEVKDFISTYTKLFNQKPSAYSMAGYDITYFFVKALKRYGKYFQFCLSVEDPEPNPQGIFLRFDFKRIYKYGGFENTGIYMLYYDKNLNLKKLDE